MNKINQSLLVLLGIVSFNTYADEFSNSTQGSGITTVYATNPLLQSINESAINNKAGFQAGWYRHKKDVTNIKLIGVGQDMGLSVLFSTTGLTCPIDQYLLFKKSIKKPNQYNYVIGNGCVATITMNPKSNSFVMTVNSRSKCFEEPTYDEFCNGNPDVKYIDEYGSRYFIGVPFIYAKDQNDDDYDYNDD